MFYENYLNSIKPDNSYIPESASFNDMAIFAQRSYQDIYNEAFFSLASQEMAVFEAAIHEEQEDGGAITSTEIDARPEQKKKLLEVVKNAISQIWAKIKGFFTGLIQKIQEKYKQYNKEHGDKIKKDFEKGVDALPDDYVAKGIYDFKWIADVKFMDNAKAVADLANKAYNDALASDWADKYNKDTIAKALGFESADKIEFEEPKKVDVKASDIKSAKVFIIQTVFDPHNFIGEIKSAYKDSKKTIDNALKAAKGCINKKDKSYADLNKACKEIIGFCKECSSALTKYISKVLSIKKAVRANYAALMSKIVAKGKKIKDVKEDTEITIDVDDKPEDTEVEVKKEEPATTDVEVKDEVEEALDFFKEEEDETDSAEDDITAAEEESCKSCKEDVDIEVNVEDDDEDDEAVEESALYKALVAYLG